MTTTLDERGRITAILHEVIAEILPGVPPTDLIGHKHLKELGADSVDRVEIIMMVIERLGLHEPMSSFNAVPDLDALVTVLIEAGSR